MLIFIRRSGALIVAVLALGLAAGTASAEPPSAPTPGAAGLGDRLFPTLGNGGYDAQHYTLSLRYPTAARSQTVVGTLTMDATATQALSAFNLDFDGDAVSSVTVEGAAAAFSLQGEELVITPAEPIRAGKRFTVTVQYTSGPYLYTPDFDNFPIGILPFGWFSTQDGSVTAGQPDRSHEIYPVNDHVADKATYTFMIDVPEGTTVAANGVLDDVQTAGGRTLWHYEMRQPMASQVVQIAVGQLDIIEQGSVSNVQLRDVAATAIADDPGVQAGLSHTREHMAFMTSLVGKYPFDAYGVLAADELFGYALETQTLSLHPGFLVDETQVEPIDAEPILVHELAHQWFGDDVAPAMWSDVWLNEGHATWYEALYADQKFGVSMVDRLHAAYEEGNQMRADFGPVALPSSNDFLDLFSDNVYNGGALVLYALYQRVGEKEFYEIERKWAQRNRGESVSTEDFIAHVVKIAHDPSLDPFLRDWLYGTEIPPMPGHPDWEAAPATVAAATASAARAGNGAQRLETARLIKR
jgi:aminopeptidase N